jgi:hypothetical protein
MQGRSPVLQVDHTPLVPTGVLVCLGLHESVTFLADLRPVQPITGWPLTTTLPPPSVLNAGILASLLGQAVLEFLSSKEKDVNDR